MPSTSLSNSISFASVAIANAVVGGLIDVLCGIYRSGRAEVYEGHALPIPTDAVLTYSGAVSTAVVGTALGLAIAICLFLASRSERAGKHLSLLVSIGWTVAFLQIAAAAIALALPFVDTSVVIEPRG